MEALNILKKIALYLVYFACGTMLLQSSLTISLYQYTYIEESGIRTLASTLLDGVYTPLLIAMVCLIVMLVVQALINKEQDDNEKRLASIANLVFFGVVLFVLVYAVVLGLTKINNDPLLPGYQYLLYPLIPVAAITIAELVSGVQGLFKTKKTQKTEN